MQIVLDIEADGLKPTKIWCIVAKDVDSGAFYRYQYPIDGSVLQNLIDKCSKIIMHNGIFYDARFIEKLLNVSIPKSKVVDTLVLSQLLNARRENGHSLEEWGKFLNFPKIEFDDFSKFSEDMLKYCENDVELTHRVYSYIKTILDRNPGVFDKAIEIEHKARYTALEMHVNGFPFNQKKAVEILDELKKRVEALDKEMEEAFPPKVEYIQMKTKVKEVITPFNPGSSRQIIERMWECGWKPTSKTKGHLEALKDKSTNQKKLEHYAKFGWKIDEENLATIPSDAPKACSLFVERTMLAARVRTLEEWLSYYNPETGAIHGEFNPLGTATHRCSHSKPNLGNVATKKTIKFNSKELRELAIHYGGLMRELWICDEGAWLVGCDMESAHLRIFAHLINDEKFTESLITGKKEDGTDPHSLNKVALGDLCVDRDRAKTFIFSFLNGAGAAKVSDIFGCGKRQASEALNRYIEAYPGLKRLKENNIPADALRGYFRGVDGRYVVNDSEHLMMGMYLQNMEATLMKYANELWKERLHEAGINFKQINWVHDEWVTQVYGSKEDAELAGKIQSESIRDIARLFKLRCPMAGEYKVGKNWLEVH